MNGFKHCNYLALVESYPCSLPSSQFILPSILSIFLPCFPNPPWNVSSALLSFLTPFFFHFIATILVPFFVPLIIFAPSLPSFCLPSFHPFHLAFPPSSFVPSSHLSFLHRFAPSRFCSLPEKSSTLRLVDLKFKVF